MKLLTLHGWVNSFLIPFTGFLLTLRVIPDTVNSGSTTVGQYANTLNVRLLPVFVDRVDPIKGTIFGNRGKRVGYGWKLENVGQQSTRSTTLGSGQAGGPRSIFAALHLSGFFTQPGRLALPVSVQNNKGYPRGQPLLLKLNIIFT